MLLKQRFNKTNQKENYIQHNKIINKIQIQHNKIINKIQIQHNKI
jgi:hypothetical protein